jgi:hypothetical protein
MDRQVWAAYLEPKLEIASGIVVTVTIRCTDICVGGVSGYDNPVVFFTMNTLSRVASFL